MTLKGIAHAAYNVSDMKASLEFYAGKLGMKHAFSIPRDDGAPWIEYIKVAEGEFIELFYSDGGGIVSYTAQWLIADCTKITSEETLMKAARHTGEIR